MRDPDRDGPHGVVILETKAPGAMPARVREDPHASVWRSSRLRRSSSKRDKGVSLEQNRRRL
jgi:hypothetical protein